MDGPRQAGKTRLWQALIPEKRAYLNYDIPEHREAILTHRLPPRSKVDTQGNAVELRFYRNVDGREVDIVLTHDARPIDFVEAKWDDSEPSAPQRYLRQRFAGVPSWQVSAVGRDDSENGDGIRVAPAHVLMSQLA